MKKIIFLFAIILGSWQNIKAQCYKEGDSFFNSGVILNSSGVKILDSLILSEHEKMETFFGLDLEFHFYGENGGSNAGFHAKCHEENCDGTLVLGLNLLYFERNADVKRVSAVLAHEFGHAIQHAKGFKGATKFKELHADFLAGYYMAKANSYDSTSIHTFLNDFYKDGGNDMDFFDLTSHGSGDERICAFLEGYCYATESNNTLTDAYNYGAQYISLNSPCAMRKFKLYQQDLLNKDVGSLKVEVEDNGNYLVSIQLDSYSINHYVFKNGKHQETVIVTQKGQFSQPGSNQNFVMLNDLGIRFRYKVSVFERTLMSGDILKQQFMVGPVKGKEVGLLISKRSITAKNPQ